MVELLVTILIVGILAAVALPTFLGQDSKARDAVAKDQVKTLQTTMRICGLDQNGSFTDPQLCNLKRLRELEPTIPPKGVSANPRKPDGGFTVTATSGSKTSFTIAREADGTVAHTCKVKDKNSPAGCALTKGKNGVW